MLSKRINIHRFFVLFPAVAPAAVWAADLPRQFTLGKHVPSECWLYIHAAHNPEREWKSGELGVQGAAGGRAWGIGHVSLPPWSLEASTLWQNLAARGSFPGGAVSCRRSRRARLPCTSTNAVPKSSGLRTVTL